ncbi:phytanoyl-CoA dioxygenase family protein [Streptomyces sp. NPDC020707]|uniref:phytanoyl-CoA dioxygenase family protein n=1 Tax=Streptomyces TaxID=1883 RepID=UPI0028D277BA|nr:phytanoyl-CoA dioxygenase family protein [Streptomyces sp. DSM 40484]
MSLTAQQTRHFRDSGYLRLPETVPEPLASRLRGLVRDETAMSPPVADTAGAQPKLYRLYQRHPELLHELITLPQLVAPLCSLLGPHVVYVLNRHNQAAINRPGTAEPRLHRDILQWTRGLVTGVVYLEEATVLNGCTHLVPGSHHLPFVGVPQPDGGGTWMDEHVEFTDLLDQALPIPMPAGGVLLFDALAFHTVSANTSADTRMSLVLGFRSADELDHQPDHSRQVLVSGNHLYRGNDRPSGQCSGALPVLTSRAPRDMVPGRMALGGSDDFGARR